ncbi:FG-GAP-like repeat-containing protein [Ekhidna lutea]|uniref:FG-GAP-like repeat-containing protein n=1 Tax=Ekhidna lutea TaxID=447679 RepID=UPI00117E8AD7|nr:FG-GAP-like repeat-containing protein [Ekhidna lutea]
MKLIRFCLILFFGLSIQFTCAQFTDITSAEIPQAAGDVAFIDFDSDGDLDLLVTGFDNNEPVCRISVNDGVGNFKPAFNLGLEGLSSIPSLAVGDYNSDALVDFAVTGLTKDLDASGNRKIKLIIYKNTGEGFVAVNDENIGMDRGNLEFGDYDNDGDLDLLGMGVASYEEGLVQTRLFRNDGNDVFTPIEFTDNLYNGDAKFVDVDIDGDLDVSIFGQTAFGELVAKLLINDGGVFYEAYEFTTLYLPATEWGDFDNDGDQDLLASGYDFDAESDGVYIYENNFNSSGDFNLVDTIGNSYWGDIEAGDFNNDNLLDFVITGLNESAGDEPEAMVYQNTGDFTFNVAELLPNVRFAAAWGDINGDDNVDLAVCGSLDNDYYSTRILRNDGGYPSFMPAVPALLTSEVDNNDVTLMWSYPNDTSHAFNISLIGPTGYVIQPSVNFSDNTTQVSWPGFKSDTIVKVKQLPAGEYFWSVQAFKANGQLSDFSTESTFNVVSELPVTLSPYEVSVLSIEDENIRFKKDVAVGDFNNDREADLLVISDLRNANGLNNERAFVFRDGKYEETSYSEDRALFISKIVETSNDELLDIVNEQGVYINDDGQNFFEQEVDVSYEFLLGMDVFDFNLDGINDLFPMGQDQYFQGVIRNEISEPKDYLTHTKGSSFFSEYVAFGDLNMDGINDMYHLLNGDLLYQRQEENFNPVSTGFQIPELAPDVFRESYEHLLTDFNNDGDVDMILLSRVYAPIDIEQGVYTLDLLVEYFENENNQFEKVSEAILSSPFVDDNSGYHVSDFYMELGDVDHDNFTDVIAGYRILLFGEEAFKQSYLIKNDSANALEIIQQFESSVVHFADLDQDLDLDLVAINGNAKYLNTSNPATDVSSPYNESSFMQSDTLILTWDYDLPFDSYNVEVLYAPLYDSLNQSTLIHPMAFDDGFRKVWRSGNSATSNIHQLSNLKEGYYVWRVQAINKALAGSEFSEWNVYKHEKYAYDFVINSNDYIDLSNILAADLDNDSDIDLLQVVDGQLSLLNNINGSLSLETSLLEVNGSISFIIGLSDINHDGNLDIIYQDFSATENQRRIALWESENSYKYDSIYSNGIQNVSTRFLVDIDRDGDIDLVDDAYGESGIMIMILHNNGEKFVKYDSIPIEGFLRKIGDYNNDGWLDAFAFDDINDAYIIYYGSKDGFDPNNFSKTSLRSGSIPVDGFIDYNNDEYIDMVGEGYISINDEGSLTEPFYISQQGGSLSIIDLNVDGKSDLIDPEGNFFPQSSNGEYYKTGHFGRLEYYSAWSVYYDIDGDGKINHLLSGNGGFNGDDSWFMADIEEIDGQINTAPSAPSNLFSIVEFDEATIYWDKAFDAETHENGLFYNVYVRSESDTIVYPYSHPDGSRKLIDQGNAGHVEQFIVTNLENGTYYWAVQTIDNGYATSPFSEELSFEVETFERQTNPFEGIFMDAQSGADFDSDGQYDMLVKEANGYALYNQSADEFVRNAYDFTSVTYAGWEDLNNDGSMDILLATPSTVEVIYDFNTPESSREILITGINASRVEAVDMGLDGVKELIVAEPSEFIVWMYETANGAYDYFDAYPGLDYKLMDANNDGKHDVFISEDTQINIYENLSIGNDNAVLYNRSLLETSFSQAHLGDINADGNMDFMALNLDTQATLYVNRSNFIFDVFPLAIGATSTDMGDLDSDGDLDIMISYPDYTEILINNDLQFDDFPIQYEGISFGAVHWIDVNGDTNLEIVISGLNATGDTVSYIHYNNLLYPNELPTIPQNLANTVTNDQVKLTWDRALDTETARDGLYYTFSLIKDGQDLIPLGTRIDDVISTTEVVLDSLADGSYMWSVQSFDSQLATMGPSQSASFEINVDPKIEQQIFEICQGESSTHLVSPSRFAENYEWTVSGGELVADNDEVTITWTESGPHWLWVTNTIYDRTDSIEMNVLSSPEASFFMDENPGTGALIQFYDSSSKSVTTWNWDFGDGNTSSESNPTNIFSQAGAFEVRLTVSNDNGCTDSIVKDIVVTTNVPVKIANVITPNNDGMNDYLYIENIERYPENSVKVYSGAGELIFSRKGYANDWYATSGGKPLSAGTYLCVLKVDEQSTVIKQPITIITR